MWKRKRTRRIIKNLKICKRTPTIMIVTKDTLKNMIHSFIHSFIYFHSINPYKVIDNLQDIEHVILLMLSRYRKSI